MTTGHEHGGGGGGDGGDFDGDTRMSDIIDPTPRHAKSKSDRR